jgi:hypothetical protein
VRIVLRQRLPDAVFLVVPSRSGRIVTQPTSLVPARYKAGSRWT